MSHCVPFQHGFYSFLCQVSKVACKAYAPNTTPMHQTYKNDQNNPAHNIACNITCHNLSLCIKTCESQIRNKKIQKVERKAPLILAHCRLVRWDMSFYPKIVFLHPIWFSHPLLIGHTSRHTHPIGPQLVDTIPFVENKNPSLYSHSLKSKQISFL